MGLNETKNEGRTGQRRDDQARSARRQTTGTLGGKVLKIRGPFLLKIDTDRDWGI